MGHPCEPSLFAHGFRFVVAPFREEPSAGDIAEISPQDWKGAFVLLVMVWILSSFLDNIAAALIGGAMAHQLFRAKVHIGYLAAIVAASNAGGAWSVLGDTTTTMMWIAGVSPVQVFKAIIATAVALSIFGVPAAIKQHKYSPILGHAHEHTQVDWIRISIVGLILILALVTNVIVNVKFTGQGDHFPFIGVAVWVAILLSILARRPDWEVLPRAFRGSMIWFGSSSGVALSNIYPEAKSVGQWVRHGWYVAVAYVIGFFVMLGVLNWHADTPHKRPAGFESTPAPHAGS
jgi:Na+/H+ antiporter NhaD/arsenite permease-like protein